MDDFFKQTVDRYCELAKTTTASLKKAQTPFLDETQTEEYSANETCKQEQKGKLADIASKVLMKDLYGARACRFDLLRPTCALASNTTKRATTHDKRLHRLIGYINQTLDHKLYGYVGDRIADCHLVCFADADFAGDSNSMRSTSGCFLCLMGPNTFYPLTACSVKQGAMSHSTPEAEIVAADHAIRTIGLPALQLWETITGSQWLFITPRTTRRQ